MDSITTVQDRRPFKAVVRRLADDVTVAREFNRVGDAADALYRAAETEGWDVPEAVFALNLAAGAAHVVDGHEYRVLSRWAENWDAYPVTSHD